ncbi:MAG: RNA 2',3'-cyclic phosphodiesterase [Actinomycetota bacterium]
MTTPSTPPAAPDASPASEERLRLFLAVPAAPQVRQYSAAALQQLRGQGDVRWVRPDRVHLTLKFLGATPADRIPKICEVVRKTANEFSSFVVELAGVGAFPNARRPHTVWLGVEPAEQISRLAAQIDQAVEGLGFEREQRAFRAHLTLGRVKSSRGITALTNAMNRFNSSDAPPTMWPIEEIELIRSNLQPTGPDYSTLERFALRRED